MLDALNRLPIDVFNLTPDDLYMWPDLAAADFPKTRFISTNLVAPDGVKSPARFAVMAIPRSERGGEPIRIGFLGLVASSNVRPNSKFSALDPQEAVASVKSDVKEKVHCWVVIGDFSEQLAVTLAAEHPDVFAVLRMERRFRLHPPKQSGNAVLLSSVERGRYLGRLTMSFDEKGKVVAYEPEFTQLDAKVPEAPEFLRVADEVKSQVP
jgi:2',3'-cyclic-nucleotide 2'-phosphodiesterase (5'-nucleotidase family)